MTTKKALAWPGEGTTETPTEGTIMTTVPTTTDVRIPSWVTSTDDNERTAFLDGELFADDKAHVYVDGSIEKRTTENGIELSAPLISIDGELITATRKLTVEELRLVIDGLTFAADRVDPARVHVQPEPTGFGSDDPAGRGPLPEHMVSGVDHDPNSTTRLLCICGVEIEAATVDEVDKLAAAHGIRFDDEAGN